MQATKLPTAKEIYKGSILNKGFCFDYKDNKIEVSVLIFDGPSYTIKSSKGEKTVDTHKEFIKYIKENF